MMMVIHFDALARTDHALITTGRALVKLLLLLFWQLETWIVHLMAQIYRCLTTTPTTVVSAVAQRHLERITDWSATPAPTGAAAIDSGSEACNDGRIGAHSRVRFLVLHLTVATAAVVVARMLVKVAKPSTRIVEIKVDGVPRIARHTHTRLHHRRRRHGHGILWATHSRGQRCGCSSTVAAHNCRSKTRRWHRIAGRDVAAAAAAAGGGGAGAAAARRIAAR